MTVLQTLTAFSNRYGADPELVLAGGGNTSAKDGGAMYVKGSGTALATITADGFVAMDRQKLASMWDKTYPEADDAREAEALADLMAAKLPDLLRERGIDVYELSADELATWREAASSVYDTYYAQLDPADAEILRQCFEEANAG